MHWYIILGWQFFSLSTLKMSLLYHLTSMVSVWVLWKEITKVGLKDLLEGGDVWRMSVRNKSRWRGTGREKLQRTRNIWDLWKKREEEKIGLEEPQTVEQFWEMLGQFIVSSVLFNRLSCLLYCAFILTSLSKNSLWVCVYFIFGLSITIPASLDI